MILSCIHTHTVFCDGRTDMETMCAAAHAAGFCSIGFSSHAPIARKTGIKSSWHMKEEALGGYIEAALKARKRWEGKLAVYLGLEVDYIEGRCGPADRDIQELPLDYVIGAVHYAGLPGKEQLFTVDGPPEEFGPGLRGLFEGDGMALCGAYFGAYRRMAEAGGCDVLAHADLIKKNNGEYAFFSPDDPRYERELLLTSDSIAAARLEAAAAPGPVVEVNTGGMIRGRTAEPYPSPRMLALLHQRAVPLTVNADAHGPDQLGGFYGAAWKVMKEAGYRSVLVFEGRRNGAAAWREEALEDPFFTADKHR